ncbi:zinc-ribbon domain-containing protein [Aeoliella mucimassa]|uniref:Zinc-ribbon domain-containing protein n=1 Tax=Aeoliella mucimassa TaxID=2527972 RepID=A0A518ALB1_9BACT|nr:zinc-ribbon domain-containing protein [Aeoliella mucimassa]QDU55486.1 hypothetical protein Pan181_16750 [Aeoliella mucimassa]
MDDDWDDWQDDSTDWDDSEYPDEYESSDSFDLVPCPHCGADIVDEAVRCPICGEYVSFSTSPWQGKPWWWIVVSLLGVGATIVALLLL